MARRELGSLRAQRFQLACMSAASVVLVEELLDVFGERLRLLQGCEVAACAVSRSFDDMGLMRCHLAEMQVMHRCLPASYNAAPAKKTLHCLIL